MGRKSDRERVKLWQKRVWAADKAYQEWEEKYKCNICEDYYYGHQWPDAKNPDGQYTINLVFPTVEIKIPSLFFSNPTIVVKPWVTRQDDTGTAGEERAKLQQDTANTVLRDPAAHFEEEGQLAAKESFWRFGVLETGYSADFIDNPNADKPILREDGEELRDRSGNTVYEPERLMENERVYIRRVPARQFRVSAHAKNQLSQNDWCGYYEYFYLEDLKKNRNLNTTGLKRSGTLRDIYSSANVLESEEEQKRYADMIKVWKIWDIRTKRKLIFPDFGDRFFSEEDWESLPFATLRYHERADHWYPVPPIYNWLDPQDELNETRQMQRVHRRRFYRRYLYQDGAIDTKELEKLETGGDGVYAKSNHPADKVLFPVPDAPLDSAVWRNIPQTKDDLREISGLGSEQRGQSERTTTATQANIVERRSQARESFGRKQIAKWLATVARQVLEVIHNRFALSTWIQINVDPLAEGAMDEMMRVANLWTQITAEELGPINFDVSVDIESMSPVAEQEAQERFFGALALVTNPQIVPILTTSELLLRKALRFFGITAEREIAEIRKAMAAVMLMAQAQAQQAEGGLTTGGADQIPENAQIAANTARMPQLAGGM